MKKIYHIFLWLVIFFCSQQLYAQYKIKSGTFSNGGGLIGNGSGYRVHGVIGQSFNGSSGNGTVFSESGFIAAAWLSIVFDNPLPVSLLDFSASTPNDTVIVIEFSTASEINVIGYNILRSENDSENYTTIASYKAHIELIGRGNQSIGATYKWRDKKAQAGVDYWYKLQNIDLDGSSEIYGPVYARLKEIPESFALQQNYPNPFNPMTHIGYELPQPTRVKIDIYNILGQHISTLINAPKEAGYHTIHFKASALPSGMYFYTIQAGPFRKVKKMMLLK